jgi:hypothetical protein
MVEFEMTWMSESGKTRTDTGRAKMEKILEWQAAIEEAVASGDQVRKITVPTDGDGDWSGSQVRAILVKSITPLAQRPAGW